MTGMKNWMLGAAMVAGAAALGTVPAQAAEFGIYVRGPVAYVPPCPGPDYFWTAGYYTNGYWIPGRWEFRGHHGPDRILVRKRPMPMDHPHGFEHGRGRW
jgi:hypothetical protein